MKKLLWGILISTIFILWAGCFDDTKKIIDDDDDIVQVFEKLPIGNWGLISSQSVMVHNANSAANHLDTTIVTSDVYTTAPTIAQVTSSVIQEYNKELTGYSQEQYSNNADSIKAILAEEAAIQILFLELAGVAATVDSLGITEIFAETSGDTLKLSFTSFLQYKGFYNGAPIAGTIVTECDEAYIFFTGDIPPKEWGTLIDTSVIDTSVIDTSVIDTSVIDTSVIDTSVIDTSVIDTSVIDTSVIDTSVIDTSVIDTSVIDTSVIDTSVIDTSVIDTSVIDTTIDTIAIQKGKWLLVAEYNDVSQTTTMGIMDTSYSDTTIHTDTSQLLEVTDDSLIQWEKGTDTTFRDAFINNFELAFEEQLALIGAMAEQMAAQDSLDLTINELSIKDVSSEEKENSLTVKATLTADFTVTEEVEIMPGFVQEIEINYVTVSKVTELYTAYEGAIPPADWPKVISSGFTRKKEPRSFPILR